MDTVNSYLIVLSTDYHTTNTTSSLKQENPDFASDELILLLLLMVDPFEKQACRNCLAKQNRRTINVCNRVFIFITYLSSFAYLLPLKTYCELICIE